jgi:hypothetical protein
MRMIADDAISGHDGNGDRISIVPGVFDISKMRGLLERETRKLGGVDLVIVDTSAAYSLCDDENSNAQMGAHARMLRELVKLPGGPCVLVLCHPIKNATDPSHLLPRGGGAFLNEMDGNLTNWMQDWPLIELHWHGKIRGPGFEPVTFRLEKIKTQELVDAKGRQIATVRAVPISEDEQEIELKRVRSDEDRLLIAMQIHPGASYAKLAESCGWVSDKGTAAKSKVLRNFERLKEAGLVEKKRDEWRLTKSGKEAAEKAVRETPIGALPT